MKKPMIGITSGLSDSEAYQIIYRQFMDVLCEAGALPVLLPITSDEKVLRSYVEQLDGFLFSGGGDVDPLLFGQLPHDGCGEVTPDRDAHELPLMRIALEANKPVLGVCRGMQLISIVQGGDVYQDLTIDKGGKLLAHRQKQPEQYPSHPVKIEVDTLLHRIIGKEDLLVNSLHHQAVNRKGAGVVASAVAPDGVIEAVEMPEKAFVLGVQWHPERLWRKDAYSNALFKAFVYACSSVE